MISETVKRVLIGWLLFCTVLAANSAILTTPATAQTTDAVRWYRVDDNRFVIYYNLLSREPVTVGVEIRDAEDGSPLDISPGQLGGDIGSSVPPGSGRRIEWTIPPGTVLPDSLDISVTTAAPGDERVDTGVVREPVVTAVRTESPVTFDGRLDDPVWHTAEPATGFIQREQHEGQPATENTEIRIVYDDQTLYIGVMCFDSEPSGIISQELRYDGMLEEDDNITLAIDTFNDRRQAFYFMTNPNGARFDGKLIPEGLRRGDTVNADWNGVWDVRAAVLDNGWSAEFAIPFKVLRFPNRATQVWGINFRRHIARKKEEVLWSAWDRDDGLVQLARAGTLTGIENVGRGVKAEFRPYALGEASEEENVTDSDFKYGLDVKVPLTSDLTLDLTTLTDFAQAEADREQINLDRYWIRYPEKRSFFLEGSEIFEFGTSGNALFYSRRIGLTADREQVPILGGAKLTGRAGPYTIGALNMQTDEKGNSPSTNYGVVRVKRNIFDQSYVGMIFGNLYDDTGHTNQAYGVDMQLRTNKFLGDKNLLMESYIAQNRPDEEAVRTGAGRFLLSYPNDFLTTYYLYHGVGDNYLPEMGFIARAGVHQHWYTLSVNPRPDIPGIQKLTISPIRAYYVTDMQGKLETRTFTVSPLGISTTSGENFSLNIVNNYEYFPEDFHLFKNTYLPKGSYEWTNFSANVSTNPSRRLSLSISSDFGDYFDGYRRSLSSRWNIKVNPHLALEPDVTYNYLDIKSNQLETKEYGLRVRTNVSTRLTSRTFVQWNNETKAAILNFSIHYIPKIGNDVYLVYNHIWDGTENYVTGYRAAILKLSYLYTF